jgi:nicotinamidase-related amidase
MEAGQFEVIGGEKNFWLYSKTGGFDLTHPRTPTSPRIYPRIQIETTTGYVAIDPSKTALVVVDLQNYFLSPSLGRPTSGVGMKVVDQLLKVAIPACRKAGIPILWLNWGLTEKDVDEMPPTIVRGFAADNNFNGPRQIKGLGSHIGHVQLEDGSVVDGGRVLMRDQWNSASYAPLEEKHQPQDICISKNRLSGFWGGTGIEEALTSRGIRTLLFSGANTDQCVGGSLQDAFTKGWDCLLLSDACATTSPDFARQCIEFNCEGGWGFVLTCEGLAKGADNMQTAPSPGV